MDMYLKQLIKGLIVISASAAIVFGANAAMDNFLESEISAVSAMSDAAAEQQSELEAAKDEATAKLLAYKIECLKLEQQEAFYQKYCNRDCYHYYGQFYELYENVYNANVWFIGTSHTAHGLNPLYVESGCTDYSFFNFALNGSNPKYYEDWWNIVLESGYPMPDTIIWCVDWFMCDDGWLWRTIDFDTAANMPIDIMRRLRAAGGQTAAETEAPETEADEAAAAADTSETSDTSDDVNWWDVDAVTGKIFANLSIIASRDRIPDMVKSWFGFITLNKAAEEETSGSDAETEAVDLVLPTYTHSYRRDTSSNITSDYYKGYIPWDVSFGGDTSTISCNDNEAEWDAFDRVLDTFDSLGIKVIFIELPEYSGVRRVKMKRNNERITEIADEHGIKFYDFNTDDPAGIASDPSNYSDWGHMSKKGSTLFSKFLGGKIKEILEN